MTRFYADAMMSEIRRITRSGGIDLAHIDHLHMAQYIEALPAALPAVLREHNVESTIMRRFAAQSSNPLIRGYAGLQARRLWRYEGRMVGRFDRCIAVTGVDGRTLRQMAPSARVEVVPDGVDTGHFRPDALPVLPEPARIVTTGDYGWPPTADGLIFFVKEIYPLIRRAMPEAAFSVVGRQPPASVRQAASARRIDVLGRVEDVRAEVLRGRVFVVPTRIGSGIRLKILEAMALGRPVVSTSIGCEGIEAAHDEHLLIADDPGAFAGYVVRLLRDPALCDRLITAASRLVRERYAWPALADRLSEIYEAVLRERRETG
jgi:glycosyltransferase involved in cell wall biosynthesis